MECIICNLWLLWFRSKAKEDVIYLHLRGAFSVARFDLSGNARAFTVWNEWQMGSTLFLYVSEFLFYQLSLGPDDIAIFQKKIKV